MHHVIAHPWRSTPAGEVTLVLDAENPSLHLAVLADGAPTEPGSEAAVERLFGVFTLHQSPDKRIPEVAQTLGDVLVKVWPGWLERRILELLNNIGGLGRAQSAGRYRAAMRTMDRDAPMDLGHPLAPLGIWGPYVEQVTREVRKARFRTWTDAKERLDASLLAAIEESVPGVLRDDLLGRTPRMLLKDRL